MSELPWVWTEYGVEVSDFEEHSRESPENPGSLTCSACCCGGPDICARCNKPVHLVAVDECGDYWMHAYWCEGCGPVPNPDGPDPC